MGNSCLAKRSSRATDYGHMIRSPPGFRVRCRLVHTEGREALAAGLAHVIFLARAFSATNSVAGRQSVRRSALPYQDALVVRCWPAEQRTGVCGSELECPGTHPRPLGGLGWAAVLASPHLQFPRGGFLVHPLATDSRSLSDRGGLWQHPKILTRMGCPPARN